MQHSRKVWPVAKLQGLRLVNTQVPNSSSLWFWFLLCNNQTLPMAFIEPYAIWSHCLQQLPVTYSTVPGCILAAAQYLPLPKARASPDPARREISKPDSSTDWAAQYWLPALRNLFSSVIGLSALVVTWSRMMPSIQIMNLSQHPINLQVSQFQSS